MKKYLFGLLLLSVAALVQAQPDTVFLKLTVTDSYTKRALSGVSVIHSKTSITQPTSDKGMLEEKVTEGDLLFLFFPGYKTTRFNVPDTVPGGVYAISVALEPMTTGLNQAVIIKAPKTLEEIEEERKKLGITPKELERPEISFTSPISALYELLSGRAQEREKLKQQISDDNRRKIFRELLNYYNENGLIDLPERDYEEFITYCNLPLEFLKYNSDYEITKTIIGLYNKYGRETGIIK